VGAFASIALIWFLTIWLIYEAIERVIHPEEVNGVIMVITASFGLLINIVMGSMLHSPLNKHHQCSHSHGND
jgi:zinc transporter 2